MGDRYFLQMTCPYCSKLNEDVYYAPSSEITDHRCNSCDKVFDVNQNFCPSPKPEDLLVKPLEKLLDQADKANLASQTVISNLIAALIETNQEKEKLSLLLERAAVALLMIEQWEDLFPDLSPYDLIHKFSDLAEEILDMMPGALVNDKLNT